MTWIGAGIVGLLFVAAVVAWWEHLGRSQDRQLEFGLDTQPRRASSVDIELDTVADPDAVSREAGQRRLLLDDTLSRMAAAATEPGRQRWAETMPVVLQGPAEDGAAAPPAAAKHNGHPALNARG